MRAPHVPVCQRVDEANHAHLCRSCMLWNSLFILSGCSRAALQRQQIACRSRQSCRGTIMRSIAPHAPVAHSWPPTSLRHSTCFTKQRPSRLSVHRQTVVLTCLRQQHGDCTAEEQPLRRRAVLQTLAAVTCAAILPAVAPAVASAGAVAVFSHVHVLHMCVVWSRPCCCHSLV